MQGLIAKQRDFFNTNQTKEISFRLKQLALLETVLKQNEGLLFEAIYQDFKKSSFETYATELALIYKEIQFAKQRLTHWARPKRVKTNLLNFPARSYILPEPLGVCLVIGAWNYPYLLSLSPAVAAIAAGNTVIVKPSELPCETSRVMKKLIATHFAEAYFAVVEGGARENSQLLQERFDKIFFTGSSSVGKIIYQAAATQLTPVTLELGGKTPAFVTASANVKMTAKRLVWGKFLNAGQTCIAPDYVWVHHSVEKSFLEACKREIEKASYAFENDNYVQIINEANFNRLVNLIDTNKIYFGGAHNALERYIQPTILHQVTMEDSIMKEEIFGPLLPVMAYDSLSEAIQQSKKLPKPLACYLFTSNKKERRTILKDFSFGGGAINDTVMHITNPHLPFGGVGMSGLGNYHGEAGFRAFSHMKSVLHKSNWLELPLKYSPLSSRKLWWIKQFFKF